MAAVSEVASRIMTQSFIGGPMVSGSAAGSEGGKGWRFRGYIWQVSTHRQGWMKNVLQDQQGMHAGTKMCK